MLRSASGHRSRRARQTVLALVGVVAAGAACRTDCTDLGCVPASTSSCPEANPSGRESAFAGTLIGVPAPSDAPRELVAGEVSGADAECVIGEALRRALAQPGPCVVLTGAGVSAESGVPTFRGQEGYWRVGSVNHHPQQLATREAFERFPSEIWAWYLHRRGVCARAQPNAAHCAIAELGPWSRALLVTQNVDGLHLRAGSPAERTYEIHGNLERMRCLAGCAGVLPLPALALEASVAAEPAATLSAELSSLLSCPGCGGWTRPHVLFFDETYDEPLFRFESSMAAAASAALLLVVGTTGVTNLPLHMGSLAWQAGATLVVVNPEPNPFSQLALRADHGLFLQGTAGFWLPLLTRLLRSLPA